MEKQFKKWGVLTLMLFMTIMTACEKDKDEPKPEPSQNPPVGTWAKVKYEEKPTSNWTSYPLDPWEIDDKIVVTATTFTFDYGANTDNGGQKNESGPYTYNATTKQLTYTGGATVSAVITGSEVAIMNASGSQRTTYKK